VGYREIFPEKKEKQVALTDADDVHKIKNFPNVLALYQTIHSPDIEYEVKNG